MSRIIRVVVVLVFLAGVVALGMQGNAWADRLNPSAPARSASGPQAAPPVAVRPAGTVNIITGLIPITGGPVTVGNCATVWVKAPPAGVSYNASVVPESELPLELPGKLVTCAIKVEAVTSTDLGSETLVCWPLLPAQSGFAYYYDGSTWVKTTSQTSDNQVCANVVPGTAPNPAYSAVFDK
jgi:hypothetical protein